MKILFTIVLAESASVQDAKDMPQICSSFWIKIENGKAYLNISHDAQPTPNTKWREVRMTCAYIKTNNEDDVEDEYDTERAQAALTHFMATTKNIVRHPSTRKQLSIERMCCAQQSIFV